MDATFPMMKAHIVLFAAAMLCLSPPLPGQGNNQQVPAARQATDVEEPNRFWQASVGGGHYMVALDKIASISRHEYVLNGNAIVDEVTVDTNGRALARFYFIRPITESMTGTNTGATAARIASRAQELVDRASEITGSDIQDRVIKTYPDTTHAGSIEYRVHSAATLNALYASVQRAWLRGKGRRFSE